METLRLSQHAAERSIERNVSEDEIHFIIQHGKREYQAGSIVYQLLNKTLPKDLPRNSPYRRLILTKVVLCKCKQYVVTVIREKEVVPKDSKKLKPWTNRQHGTCPCCNHSEAA